RLGLIDPHRPRNARLFGADQLEIAVAFDGGNGNGRDAGGNVGLAGFDGANAHGIFGQEAHFDALEIGRASVLGGAGRPVIVLETLEDQVLALGAADNLERAGTDGDVRAAGAALFLGEGGDRRGRDNALD